MAKKHTKKTNDGKEYEAKVSKMVRQLYPQATIRDDVKLPAIITRGERQVDTLLSEGTTQMDFDAKDHKRNIGIDDIASYGFKLKDENVPLGVMVSNSPYAESAIAAATHFGIRPTHLIDTSDEQNLFSVASNTLIVVRYVKSLGFGVSHKSIGGNFNVYQDLGKQKLVSDNGDVVSPAYNVFQTELWNSGFLLEQIRELDDQGGSGTYTLSRQKIVMADGTYGIVDKFFFDYEVGVEYLEGKWNVRHAQGIFDAAQKTLLTNQPLESETLSIEEMRKWPTIEASKVDRSKYGVVIEVIGELPDAPSTDGMG